ncbi:hypothetical protein [Paraburkholderia caballeronis]|uniref:hypothetical protein n=1 Tax=Paraburkholderia caballeronis TaxID=416943 RepID=UPI0010665655|nr:hypothetical protein [Paraburkholderia caballeronis]TDV15726.1 hypothetical protein C7408_106183 [Paraburkholderia caballeronis]TDV17981.1 hypothetical protein C7406_105183 [Paraburkholderia caballeronis]TDV26405.1 hypothetical protein C7404_106108 [Paraburkholderia caballeronis]
MTAPPACGRAAANPAAPLAEVNVASLAHELQWIERMRIDGEMLDALLTGRRFVYIGGRPVSGGMFVPHVALIDADRSERADRFAALCVAPRGCGAVCARHHRPRLACRAARRLCASNVASFIACLLRGERRRHEPSAASLSTQGCRTPRRACG